MTENRGGRSGNSYDNSNQQSYRRRARGSSHSSYNRNHNSQPHYYNNYDHYYNGYGGYNSEMNGGSSFGYSYRRPPSQRRQHRPQHNHRRDYRVESKETVSPAIAVQDNQATSLRHQIESNTYECMVCYETINAFCATYSCFQCFNIFHLTCIRQWASSKLTDSARAEDTAADWTCPACQVSSTTLPFRYICFCASVVNPEYKSFILPHSCGEKCTRIRESCSHPCPELCHPGKCPACPASVITYCSCATETKRVKCSQKDVPFKCNKVCGKLLNCKKHKCDTICHSGDCDDCPELNELICYCGKSSKDIPCGFEKESLGLDHTGYWSCFEQCSRPLTCKNHSCHQRCHSGPCQPCETDITAIDSCPCGKTKLEKITPVKRESCLDLIPTCKKTCKKPLSCGTGGENHCCQVACHNGPCPPCLDKSVVMCACQSSSEAMLCSDIPEGGLRCEKVCYKKKSCGRHRCNTKCCLEDNHICMIPCGKMLSCKKHKCEELCHRGHCMPCLLSTFHEVYCTCGKTKLDPPVACGTPPPKCNDPCNREHSCTHAVTHTCHTGEQCPPCAQLINKVCMGGHAVRFNVPCHVQDVSCGEVCKKHLPCNMHTCERWCHKEECVPTESVCELPCSKTRILCSHSCNAKCHPGKACPTNVCFEKIKVSCECRRRIIDLLCFKGSTLTSDSPDLGRYNTKLKSVNISVSQQDLLDYLKSNKVSCVEKCKVEERNQRMAESLGLKDVPVDNLVSPTYSEFLHSITKTNKEFVIDVENVFADLISKYKKRNQSLDTLNKIKFVYHDFKAMNKDKRRAIHELAAVYKMTSQSFDEEPQRSVQVRIAYNSEEPSLKLSQYAHKRVIGGVGSKPAQKPTPTANTPNLQTLNMRTMHQGQEIVFDSWEDINEC